MPRSMTGFGAGRATVGAEEISVELRSVNHKFCEVKARLPRELAGVEQVVVRAVKERLARGAVDVVVRRERSAQAGALTAISVDEPLAREYHRALAELARATGSSEPVPLALLAQQPGVLLVSERTADPAQLQQALETALAQALDALVAMREREGAAIGRDLLARLAVVERTAEELALLAPRAVEEYRARLSERIAELTRGAFDEQRLVQEVAFYAERTDVAEEVTRLRSHLAQFRALLLGAEPAGRKMDFIVQEMHREVNTTGAKSQQAEISQRVVALKAEIERIREQVQNVE